MLIPVTNDLMCTFTEFGKGKTYLLLGQVLVKVSSADLIDYVLC